MRPDLGLLLLFAACDDTLFGVADGEPETGDPIIADPDYIADIEPIWLDRCEGCHTDGGAQAGLALDAGEEALAVASTQQPALMLVEPGEPEASYLWLKLMDDPTITGSAMPQGLPLSAGHLGTIEAWILTISP